MDIVELLQKKKSDLLAKIDILNEMIEEEGGDMYHEVEHKRTQGKTPLMPETRNTRKTEIVDRGGSVPGKILSKNSAVNEDGKVVETIVELID